MFVKHLCPLPQHIEIGLTFGPINRDHQLIKDYLPSKFSVRQIHRTVGPAGQISDRSDLPHFQPDRYIRCCFQYYVNYVFTESDRYKFGPMK